MLYATKRLIDSVWTLEFEFTDNHQVMIHSYDRDNPIGYNQERELPVCSLIQTDERTVTHVMITKNIKSDLGGNDAADAVTYEVANKQYIFSYLP